MPAASDAQAPTIRTFKFDGSSKGVVGSNVNQFRGDVNLTRPLFTNAWYLTTITDRFGGQVSYDYNGFDRGGDGLIPGCEQLVGTGGKAYTKAVYLNKITDVFGRTASFVYDEKLWNSGAADPREYADPHRATPSNDPGPWQDQYQTRYLSSIAVADAGGTSLFSMDMGYDPSPSAGANSAVANVTPFTGQLQGDT